MRNRGGVSRPVRDLSSLSVRRSLFNPRSVGFLAAHDSSERSKPWISPLRTFPHRISVFSPDNWKLRLSQHSVRRHRNFNVKKGASAILLTYPRPNLHLDLHHCGKRNLEHKSFRLWLLPSLVALSHHTFNSQHHNKPDCFPQFREERLPIYNLKEKSDKNCFSWFNSYCSISICGCSMDITNFYLKNSKKIFAHICFLTNFGSLICMFF